MLLLPVKLVVPMNLEIIIHNTFCILYRMFSLKLSTLHSSMFIRYLICLVTSRNYLIDRVTTMWIYGWELLVLCLYADKSCDHKYFDGGDVIFLICHRTCHEHMFKVYVNLWVEARHCQSPSQHASWPLV